MSLSILKYLGILSQVLGIMDSLEHVGGEPVETRPSYKGKKFSITIKRLS